MESPLSHSLYVVLDLEFTGLSPLEGDAIVEIAGVRLEGGATVRTLHTLVNPERVLPQETEHLTGLTDRELRCAPRFPEIVPALLDFLGDAPIVTHNLAYDIAALQWDLMRHRFVSLPNFGIDTLELARRVYPGQKNNLRDLAHRLGIAMQPTHRALDDARVTAEAFIALIRILETRGEVRHFRDLHPVPCRDYVLAPREGEAEWELLRSRLVHAVTHRRQLRILYAGSKKPAAERVIEPFCLIGPYLRAYCLAKNRELNFLVSRIRSAEETGEPVTHRPEPPRGPAVFSPAHRYVPRDEPPPPTDDRHRDASPRSV
jgi:DNA polymerase III epsilon subunit family exonuclease